MASKEFKALIEKYYPQDDEHILAYLLEDLLTDNGEARENAVRYNIENRLCFECTPYDADVQNSLEVARDLGDDLQRYIESLEKENAELKAKLKEQE